MGASLPLSANKERQIRRQHGLQDGGRSQLELARQVPVASRIEDLALAPTLAAETEQRDTPPHGRRGSPPSDFTVRP